MLERIQRWLAINSVLSLLFYSFLFWRRNFVQWKREREKKKKKRRDLLLFKKKKMSFCWHLIVRSIWFSKEKKKVRSITNMNGMIILKTKSYLVDQNIKFSNSRYQNENNHNDYKRKSLMRLISISLKPFLKWCDYFLIKYSRYNILDFKN